MDPSETVRTRLLILSDTHGFDFTPDEHPQHEVDVIIHCGDLTNGSKLSEFRTTIDLIKRLKAPLKLLIAGNHDFTLDSEAFTSVVGDARRRFGQDLVDQEYGVSGKAQELFEDACQDGIQLLNEGTHRFQLVNGANLTVFASPYTPASRSSGWGFQYDENREFEIEEGTDVVVTHGPPLGIMDCTLNRGRAGCRDLFGAIYKAKPRIHCFGHIHESWGARLVTWKEKLGEQGPNHFTSIDNANSHSFETLARLRPRENDDPVLESSRLQRLEKYAEDRCCRASVCPGDEAVLADAKQTLFVNASIYDAEPGMLIHRPWLVDVDLPRSQWYKHC